MLLVHIHVFKKIAHVLQFSSLVQCTHSELKLEQIKTIWIQNIHWHFMAKLLSLKKTATWMLKPLNYNSGWLSEFMDPQSNLGLWLWLLPSCISVPAIRCLNSQCPLKLSPPAFRMYLIPCWLVSQKSRC